MRKKKYSILAWTITTILGLFIVFAIWYKLTYSMDQVEPYSLNSEVFETKLLIASQGSTFKNALVTRITDHYKEDSIFIQVVDVSGLPKISASDYTAILIIHTWEYDKPPEAVTEFVENSSNPSQFVVLSTSGEGGNTIDGVDGISGESVVDDVPDYSMRVISKLDALLNP